MKLSPVQQDLLSRLQNPSRSVDTVEQAYKTGCDDPLLIKETGEVRMVNIYNGASITGTLDALKRRGLLDYRMEGNVLRTFYIRLI